MQYSSPAMATGKTAFLKNSLTASVLVIGSTSIPASHYTDKIRPRPGAFEKVRQKRTILPILVRDSAASAVRLPLAFPAGPPHSGGGCRTPAPPAGPSDIPIAGRSRLAVSPSISARSRLVAGRGTASRRFSSLAAASNRMISPSCPPEELLLVPGLAVFLNHVEVHCRSQRNDVRDVRSPYQRRCAQSLPGEKGPLLPCRNARRWSSLKQSWTRKPSQPPSAARDTKLAPSKRSPIKREGSSVYNLKAASFNPQVVYGNPAILSMS